LAINPLVRARVIVVANQKGGVGKTTTAVNLAAELSALGLPVVVIDMDSQGNATDGLGVKVTPETFTLYEVLHPNFEKRVPIQQALVRSPYGPAVLCGHTAMAAIERDGNGPGGELSLATAISATPSPVIYVVDTPPNLGRLTTMALAAAGDPDNDGEVLVTVSPGANQLKGLYKLMRTVAELKANGVAKTLHLGTVLTTNYDGRNKVNVQSKVYLRKTFDQEYLGEISHTVAVDEAIARNMPLRDYAPESTAAEDYRTCAREYALKKGLVRAA
jgi:chromosome partitioning protein